MTLNVSTGRGRPTRARLLPGLLAAGLGLGLLSACGSTANTGGTSVKTDALTFDTTTVPAAYVGEDFSANLRVSGGVGPYGYRLASGSLPPGMKFADGVLSGKPTTQGAYTFTLEATDANLSNKVATYTLNVSELPPLAVELTLPASEVRGETRIPVVLKYTRGVRAAKFTWDVGPDVKVTKVQSAQDGNPLFWRQVGSTVTVDMGFKTVPRSGQRVALLSVKPGKTVKLSSTNFWYESRDGKGELLSEKKAAAPATQDQDTTAPTGEGQQETPQTQPNPDQTQPAPTQPDQADPAQQTTPGSTDQPERAPNVPGSDPNVQPPNPEGKS